MDITTYGMVIGMFIIAIVFVGGAAMYAFKKGE